ncbi:hypothetical protein HHL11_02635 [Ramlibacter sp. G-1-2-2]|uniref:Uncharacterized protein n=1 Tax=Ramlibacter agri TaxID=2728837 RepID=A0A848H0L3_9BURK|nr:hypothetical protein [Ramlibacter agri]NML42630.1 hypothetical protein [Ramlibacter agri]
MGTKEPARERGNLLVQLQAWPWDRVPRESLVPPPQGGTEAVAYGFLGDMQLRFVFDEPGVATPAVVRPQDLLRLELQPPQAVAHAVANFRRLAGPPQVASLGNGVYSLRGQHRDYDPCWLLDRTFWRAQLAKFPQGLLAALPRRGMLMFVPAGDPASEGELSRQATRLLANAGDAALSACIYRFDEKGWHPHAELARPAAPPPRADDDDDAPQPGAEEADLEKAARGQRMLVFSILGGFVLNALEYGANVSPVLVLALSLALTVYSLLGVLRLASGLRRSVGAKVACMVLTFLPLANLLTWIVLSVQATRALRAAGWRVGLLGARE